MILGMAAPAPVSGTRVLVVDPSDEPTRPSGLAALVALELERLRSVDESWEPALPTAALAENVTSA